MSITLREDLEKYGFSPRLIEAIVNRKEETDRLERRVYDLEKKMNELRNKMDFLER